MKIAIVGGGPAGLYCATALRKLMPRAQVDIYEKHKRSVPAAGYVIQHKIMAELAQLDTDCYDALGKAQTPVWDRVEVEAKGLVEGISFAPSTGLRRSGLLAYLEKKAEDSGVAVQYGTKLTSADVERLRQESDFLVGADGIKSVVRNTFPQEFGDQTLEGKTSLAWFEGVKGSDFMRAVIAHDGRAPYVLTTYPIDAEREAIIIESPTAALDNSGVLSLTPMRRAQHFESVFNTPTTHIRITTEDKWNSSRIVTCRRLAFDNVALIGEAGVSAHYTIGAGLLVAFRTAWALAQTLAHSPKNDRSWNYHDQIEPTVDSTLHHSLRSLSWLENLERHYRTLNAGELLTSFRHKT